MTATRYFTVDSVVQPVQPAASTAATTTADSSTAAPSAGRGGIVQVAAGYNRDRDQTATTTASSSPLQPATDHPPTSVNHLPLLTTTTAHSSSGDAQRQQLHRKRYSVTDLMDKLLEDIYRVGGSSVASESSTDQTNWSDGGGRPTIVTNEGWSKRLTRKSVEELSTTVDLLRDQLNVCCEALVKALKRRDILIARRDAKCNMITALLHAYSMKRNRPAFEPSPPSSRPGNSRPAKYSLSKHIWNTGDVMNGLLNTLKNIASLSEDTKMRFNMKPGPGDTDFEQWQSAMKMVARLPDGVPHEFRNTLWLTLAEKYLSSRNVEWPKVERFCFNDTTNPDDEELGVQIVKDLHRTGCSLFCGSSGLENQALLKRVLLGFARWNKAVGYCQGFNMLAALILQVMEKNESDALKVMIYLIEGVLPEGYFANNLRGLSVDMAVFRDLLRVRLQNLSRHLDRLQTESKDSGTSYEPPLTNVFTMQWFLTLFCNCLPQRTVLRVWDLIFLEGSTVLLKTALAIWDALSDRIMTVTSADEFYSIMAVLTREMLEFGLMDANNLINTISTMNELVEVKELRERYMYNINPWVSHVAKRGLRLFYTESDIEETDSDDDIDGKSSSVVTANNDRKDGFRTKHNKSGRSNRQPTPSLESEREKVALDISSLKKQYSKLKERQKQVQVILTAACNGQNFIGTSNSSAMNHLLFGKTALRCTSIGPIPGSIPLKYIQDVKKPEPKTEPRVREKRTVSSSSSSSTSTELCDDPASDCCSERSVDDDVCNGDEDGDGNADLVVDVVVECRLPDVKSGNDDDSDVSLAEMLRANSELLKRMCRGKAPADDPEIDLEERLPDLINDISMLGESLTTVETSTADSDYRGLFANDSITDVEGSADNFRDLLTGESQSATETSAASDFQDFLADESLSAAERDDRVLPPQQSKGNQDNVEDSATPAPKPFAPFPSKVRQPKRLGIELGLYPDGSN
ncbi:TBC1 domain family member 30 isoform X1 [Acyrthosiphon pisum]|uniref:TBC1 domain family member 30 n=1 Tax=Acyrthosiphon pisum TaxID=7029 RepID=A0A8R2F9G5_ACYPI|nr:TBC1 domain family member 30 isoform X1 [Acyrthosiphon pisum]|eukprot:XP_008184349.1 PREDICTED: TBC1 domain family member 30 isoform X1 [Acyrthosiphon pisum]